VDALVPSADFVGTVARVVGKRFDEPQLAVECAEVVALQIDVEVRVDLSEPVSLVPPLNVCIVAGPHFESLESPLAGLPLGFFEQCGRDSRR
jgi:hypothetical protein